MKEVQGMCNYCGTGCSVVFHVDEDQDKIVKITGAKDYPVNKGVLCPKGFKAFEYINSPDRAHVSPLIRQADGSRRVVSWQESIDFFTLRIKEIQAKYGKKSVAFLSTGQLFLEDFAILGMLRGVMGIQGDGNTRLCMASAIMAYKQAFGYDAPPFCYKDLELSECLILIGSNAAITHPIVFNRALKNREGRCVIVIDPRKTETAQKADWHLPIKPKADLTFLYMLASELLRRDRKIDWDYIRQHTSNFEAFQAFVKDFDATQVEKLTGISRELFDKLVEQIENSKTVAFVWTMGANQSHEGTLVNHAIINICLMTGNIGKPGTGPCSLTGQTNAMGSRIFSNTTSLFGGRDFTNEQHRRDVCRILGVGDEMIPDSPTLSYGEIIDAIEKGEIKALWVVATNPLYSAVNIKRIRRVFKNLEFLAVQDLFDDTQTALEADVFFPACTMGEKEGVLVNSERRLMYSQQAVRPAGQSLSDFEICLRIWKSWGDTQGIENWLTQEICFKTLIRLSEGMPCDICGISDYAYLQEKKGIQWPYRALPSEQAEERRLFEDGRFYTDDSRAKFIFGSPVAHEVELTEEYPLYLMTGRGSVFQFHSTSRTGRCPSLNKAYDPDCAYFEIAPATAKTYAICKGEKVRIVSRVGDFIAVAKVTQSILDGHIYLPLHFQGVNGLLDSACDPTSKQPSLKSGAVRLEKIG